MGVGVPFGEMSSGGEVLGEGGSSVGDSFVVGLERVDDVGTGFAAEDLEGEVGGVAVGSGFVSRRTTGKE